MGFLDTHWKTIQQSNEIVPAPNGTGPFPSWNYVSVNMSMIVCALKLVKPTMVIELGTFEGWGTVEMAKAINSYADNAILWTIDAGVPVDALDGDPTKVVTIDWKQGGHYQRWGEVIDRRNQNLSKAFQGCTVNYLEGITWDVLPDLLEKEGSWDFCFQDSVHHGTQQIKEWLILREYSHPGTIIVFDDVINNDHSFLAWFKDNESEDWEIRYTEEGHGQLWAEQK